MRPDRDNTRRNDHEDAERAAALQIEILEATTDTAVNTSPMLTMEQKAEIVLHKSLTHKSLHDKIDSEIRK